MAEDPSTLQTPKSDDNNNSNPQSTENPTPAGAVPISTPSSSTPFAPVQIPPPLPPSFRPVMSPVGVPPLFVSAQSHPGYLNPNLQPLGMSGGFPPPPGQFMQQQQQTYQQQNPPPVMRPFVTMPNGYPPPPNQGTVPIPGGYFFF